MKLIDKIKQARTKKDLDLLRMEIIMDMENFKENQKAFIEKLAELEEGASWA